MKKQISIFIIAFILLFTSFLSGCLESEEKKEEKENIETIAVQTINYLSNDEYSKAYQNFNETVKQQMSLLQLEEIWNQIITIYGDFVIIISTKETKEQGLDIIYVTVNFSNNSLDIRLVFNDELEIIGLQFLPVDMSDQYNPPDYSDSDAFTEINVTIGTISWALPGTLSIPKGEGPFPAVILVHGSGQNDRDETVGPNKPFKDLAWGLATKGIAVLRYEKRSKAHSEKFLEGLNFTVREETIDDAIYAVDLLNNTEKINTSSIFVLGHSLGGMLAPRIASMDDRIAGIILLAAPTRPLEDLILNQTVYLAELDGEVTEAEQAQINLIEQQIQKIKELNISEGEMVMGAPYTYWKDLSEYSPIETAQNLSLPMLILQGERDYQVTVNEDFAKWNITFFNDVNVILSTYEHLNHLFISGSGQPTNLEYFEPGNIEETVILDIEHWIIEK